LAKAGRYKTSVFVGGCLHLVLWHGSGTAALPGIGGDRQDAGLGFSGRIEFIADCPAAATREILKEAEDSLDKQDKLLRQSENPQPRSWSPKTESGIAGSAATIAVKL
jgi:hypothetical protein